MHGVQLVERVRSIVHQTFAELGSSAELVPSEAMLIRDGFFCGRRFVAEGLEAVWFVEENEIKFYDSDGAVLQVVHPTPALAEGDQRKAA